jgi:hypothetical protein
MVDKTSSRKAVAPQMGGVVVVLSTIDTPTLIGGTDTLTMTLADFGIKNVVSVMGFLHTTDNSVIVADAGTTAVSAGVLTYTTAAGNNNKKRVVVVFGES